MASMSEDLFHTSSTSITDKKRTTIITDPAWSNKTIKHGGEREREGEERLFISSRIQGSMRNGGVYWDFR